MFEIRNEQIQAVNAPHREQFLSTLMDFVRRQHPETAAEMSDQELRGRVEFCRSRSEGHGMISERAIAAFVDLCFALRPDFDIRETWASKILSDSTLDGNQRAAKLLTVSRNYVGP